MARENLLIKTGSYTGDGTDSRNITGIGFRPDLVIIKSGTQNTVFRTKERRGDSTGFLTSTNTDLTDRIQELLNDGFQVGTAAQVNSPATVYYYICIRGLAGQSHFRTGHYYGNATDNRNLTGTDLNATPDIVMIQAISGAVAAVCKTNTMIGDTSTRFDAAGAANQIQSLINDGFQLGTAVVNGANVEHFYFVLRNLAGAVATGTYSGTGASLSITGLGFKPDVVILKNYSAANQGRILTSQMIADKLDSLYMGNTASDTQGITSLDADGFTVGTSTASNGSGNAIHWIALKSGNFFAPVSRNSA